MRKITLLTGIFLSFLLLIQNLYAQDPYKTIEKIEFGTGVATYGSTLASTEGSCPYTYSTSGQGALKKNNCISAYSRIKTARSMGHANYIDAADHTGNINGYMLIIGYSTANTNYNIYTHTFNIPSTTLISDENYKFTIYIANPVNKASTPGTIWKPTSVTLSLKNPDTDAQLATSGVKTLAYETSTTVLNWVEVSLTLPPSQIPASRKVKLVLTGNYDGAAWNEILLDDVTFSMSRKSDVNISAPEPGIYPSGTSVIMTADMSSSSLTPPIYYKWQSSTDNHTYTNIATASGSIASKNDPVTYTTPQLNTGSSTYYRMIYAESETNLSAGNYYKTNTLQPLCDDMNISGPTTIDRYKTTTYTLSGGNPGIIPNWVVTGGCIISGQGTNSIQVVWTSNSNTRVRVYLKADGFTSTIQLPTHSVSVNDTPKPTISGPEIVNKFDKAQYTISNNDGTGLIPTWEVYGGIILSGQGTNSISVSWSRTSQDYETRVIARLSDNPGLTDLDLSLPVSVGGRIAVFSDQTWYFGFKSGLIFKSDQYGNYSPTVLPKNTAKTLTQENALSVSNPYCNGENVFYTSHNEIFNSTHQKFGTFSGHSSDADGLACCYIGKNKYALFSISADESIGNLYYYTVNMSANSGSGSISGGTLIASGGSIGEGLELIAVPGTNNQYWLLFGKDSKTSFKIGVVKVTADLENGTISLGSITYYNLSSIGAAGTHRHIVANPEGTVFYFSHVNTGGHLCRFNPINGTMDLTSLKKIYTGTNGYSAAFSPNGKIIYLSRVDINSQVPTLYQVEFDAEQTPITFTSRSITMTKENPVSGGTYSNNSQTPKLGPDNKIYVNRSYHNPYITIIHTPDIVYGSAGFQWEERAIDIRAYLDANHNFGDEWSTGITPPATQLPGANGEPQCPIVRDNISDSNAPTPITVNVKAGVSDPNGDNIFLIGAIFDNPAENRGTLSFNDATGTVTFTPSGTFSPEERILIRYKVKDDGYPGARCADGILSIGFGNYVAPERSPIIFVAPRANGTGDGTSWANATDQLQSAIDQAYASTVNTSEEGFDLNEDGTNMLPYQVHIANGTYSTGFNFPVGGLIMKEGVNVFVEDNNITNVSETEVIINGDLYLEQYAEASAWRYFGMPFTGNTDNIFDTYHSILSVNNPSSGESEPEALVEYYDVANRGLTASSTGDEHSHNWKMLNVTPHSNAGIVPYYSGNNLLKGYGYIIVADAERIRVKATEDNDKNSMFKTENIVMPTVYFEHPDAANKSPWFKTDYGWNLLSNPYSSYYRFDGANHDFENPGNEEQDGALYSLIYWSEERGEYVALSRYDDAYLPPFKPVFFQVPDNSVTSFTFHDGTVDDPDALVKGSGRMGGRSIIREDWTSKDANGSPIIISGRNFRDLSPENTPMMRSSSSKTTEITTDVIFLEISGNTHSDKTAVIINPKASKGYDLGWDLDRVVYANRSLPQIWTELDGHAYGANELPASTDGITKVPVHFYTGETATYRIGLGKANRLSYLNRYYLQNTQTGETKSLSAGDSFEIYASAGETTDNLVLIIENTIKSQASIDEALKTSAIIYAKDRNICIEGISSATIVEIFDISGRCIQRLSVENSKCNIPVNAAGVYIVSVKSKTDKQIKKVIINK